MNPRLPAVVAALIGLTGPALAQGDSTQAESPGIGPLAFAWPVPCEARVTQRDQKDGKDMTMRYTVRLARAQRGEDLEIRFTKFEVLRFNGQDMTGPEAKMAMAAQLPMLQAAYPQIRIARTGEYLGIPDWEGHVDRTLAMMRDLGRSDPQVLEGTRNMMLNPQYRSMLQSKSGEFWQVWVSAWLGAEIAEGETLEGLTEIPIGEELVEAKLSLHHLGAIGEGHVRLGMKTVLEGEQARRAFLKVMKAMASQGPKPLDGEIPLEAFSKKTKLSVVTDPKTLQPREAKIESLMSISMKGEGSREKVEKREYAFEWGE